MFGRRPSRWAKLAHILVVVLFVSLSVCFSVVAFLTELPASSLAENRPCIVIAVCYLPSYSTVPF